MKHFAMICTSICICVLMTFSAYGQPTCFIDPATGDPQIALFDNNGNAYTNFTPGQQNWEIHDQSIIGNPVGNPHVLHTNPGNGVGYQSPQWLTTGPITGFNWQYNKLIWTFWFGRGQGVGQNGGNNDGSIVWLYVNTHTTLDLVNTPGLEGIRVMWHHNSNDDNIRLSEIYNGVEHVIGDFVLIDNLSLYEWGTTVKVERIPGGEPNGSEVTYKLYLSTPDPTTPNFTTFIKGADADPDADSHYERITNTLTSPWTPTSTTGFMGVHSYYAASRKDAAEYTKICFLDDGPTPVELNAFSARYRNDLVYLDWGTATETDNYGFEVQRSVEHNGSWETIAFIDGNGTTSSPHDYSYIDAPRFDGAKMIAYRLKQIDRDGSFEFSNTILVTVSPHSADVLYNFPNPFNPATNIQFNLSVPDIVTLQVYDAAGQLVRVLYDMEPLESGYHTVSFSGEGLPAGSYYYRLSTIQETRTGAMILTK